MNIRCKKARLFLLVAAVGLSGCHKTEEGKDTVTNIYQNLEGNIEEIKNISYDNLSLEKLKNVSFPDISACAQIEITHESQTLEDAYASMQRCVEQWYPDLTEDALQEILEVELSAEGYLALQEHFVPFKDYLQNLEKYQDYFVALGFRYEHGEYTGGTWKNNVTTWQRYRMRDLDTELERSEIEVFLYMPAKFHGPIAFYKWYEFSDDTYMLSDGEISIKEAAALFKDYFENRLPYDTSKDLQCNVAEIAAYEIQEGLYGLEANIRREYKSIPFACWSLYGSSFESYTDYEEEYVTAGIVETGEVDYCFGWDAEGNVRETATVDEILTLESVIKIVNTTFSGEMMLDIVEISFEYVRIGVNEQTRGIRFSPVWRLTAYNRSDGRELTIFIEPVSGLCSYKVSIN